MLLCFALHHKIIRRSRYWINFELYSTESYSNIKLFMLNSQVRNGKMRFSCFGQTFGPIWMNFRQKQIRLVHIVPKFGLKQKNCTFPLQTSSFSHQRPKKIFVIPRIESSSRLPRCQNRGATTLAVQLLRNTDNTIDNSRELICNSQSVHSPMPDVLALRGLRVRFYAWVRHAFDRHL